MGVRTVIQLAYTTLFGYHCAFLFLRTGSVYPPVFSHMFCNFMGLPQIAYELQVFPHRKASECLHLASSARLWLRPSFQASSSCIFWV